MYFHTHTHDPHNVGGGAHPYAFGDQVPPPELGPGYPILMAVLLFR